MPRLTSTRVCMNSDITVAMYTLSGSIFSPPHSLRISSTSLYTHSTQQETGVDRWTYSNYGDRCLTAAGLKLWNSLPAELQQADINCQRFKRLLKTFFQVLRWQRIVINQGSFPKKRNSGNTEFERGSRRRRHQGGEVWIGGVRFLPERSGAQKFFFRFWMLNRRILVQIECFLHSSNKAGLNAILDIGESQNAKH